MAHKSLDELASKMQGIDIAMLSTKQADGEIATRPMSNNSDVDYDGDSYYFTYEDTSTVSDIEADSHVSLAFSEKTGLLAGRGFYVVVEGAAEVVRDKTLFDGHRRDARQEES